MPSIAFVACQKPDGNTPIHKIIEACCTETHMIGDYVYNDGATTAINGVTPAVLKFGDASNTVAECVKRFEAAYGRTGRPQYRRFWQAVDAGLHVARCMEDDHDFAWNNNDFDLATFKGAFNVAAGSSTTDTLALTDVRDQWRLGQTACRQVRAAYFANQMADTGNGDIPQQMVGVAGVTADDFRVCYYYVDYDARMRAVATGVGTNAPPPPSAVVRVIVPDCKRFTDPASKTDNASKTMLGKTQEAWLWKCIQDGQACAAGVTIAWTKDLFNRDNGDGGVGFRTYFDALLSAIDTAGYAVDHITGDRHNPHAGIARKQFGAAYDATSICCCPSGQGTGGLTQYPENVMSYAANDACVVGTLEIDMLNRIKILTMRDFFSWEPLCQVKLKFRERVPSIPVYIAKLYRHQGRPAMGRVAYAASGSFIWPASTVAWVNPYEVPVGLAVAATMTAASISTDSGVTFDNALQSGTGGYWVIPPRGQFKMTYSAITAFVTSPLVLN